MTRLVAILMLIGIFAAACTSGGMAVDEYATAVEALSVAHADEVESLRVEHFTELDTSIANLQGTMEGEALLDAAIRETARRTGELFAAIADSLDRYIEELERLDTPAELSVEHDDYLKALRASRAGISPILETLPLATSFDEIDRAIAGSGFADAQLRVDAACTTLERTIGNRGLDVDLRCEEAK